MHVAASLMMASVGLMILWDHRPVQTGHRRDRNSTVASIADPHKFIGGKG